MLYEGNDRVRQVNAVRRLAADIADYTTEDPIGDDIGEVATEAVDYYLKECDVMPDWFDAQDRDLLVRFVGKALQ